MKSNEANEENVGYPGVTPGTNLTDLIQIECLMMSSRMVHVKGGKDTGRIYFGGGQIVHAETEKGKLEGAEAVFEMALWKDSDYKLENCKRPPKETVTSSWEAILLEAAQHTDETEALDLVKSIESIDLSKKLVPISRSQILEDTMINRVRNDPEVTAAIHFDNHGELLEGHGDITEEIQDSFAFLTEMGRLVGSSFGLEPLEEIRLIGKEARGLCLMNDESCVSLIGTSKANLASISKKLRKPL